MPWQRVGQLGAFLSFLYTQVEVAEVTPTAKTGRKATCVQHVAKEVWNRDIFYVIKNLIEI